MSIYDPGSGFRRTPGRGYDLANDHPGVDWWADVGTPIPAAAAGTVVGIGYEDRYGNVVILRHGGDAAPYRYTLYAHMEPTQPVAMGDVVHRGQAIGYVDSTGTGGGEEPHLHFELISLSDFTLESEWSRYSGGKRETWPAGRIPLMLTSEQGRIDPLLAVSWIGIDVYSPPSCRGGGFREAR